MKKILITGANSYIGISVENYLKKFDGEYQIDTVDMIDGTWREKDFSPYDVVFHVAGIAHQKETKENAALYYTVNRDLAIETATKAKTDGVKQFVFLSSMSVYGMETGVITKETTPNPKTHYGIAKLEAEQGIITLASDDFSICTLRPPMVYGKGCKGNFQTVCKLVKKSPIFPKVNNERSMIYIDNLCAFVKLCVDRSLQGLYFPQNNGYVKTSDMARVIAETTQKRLWISGLAGVSICAIRPFVGIAKKAFGSLTYRDTEDFGYEYCIIDNTESFRLSVE